jgi:hypothetical protein
MESKDDSQPMVRVKTEIGMVYYPKFEKNTEGKWIPVDPSFQKINKLRHNSEMRVKHDKD